MVALLAATGCEIFGPSDYFDVEILTDKSTYIADSTEVIRVRLTNRSEGPVHYVCGIGFSLEELDGATVTKSWAASGICLALIPRIIPVGAELTFDLSFRGINARIRYYDEHEDYGRARFGRSVEYRLKAQGLYTEKFGREDQAIPLSARVSNRFRIERP